MSLINLNPTKHNWEHGRPSGKFDRLDSPYICTLQSSWKLNEVGYVSFNSVEINNRTQSMVAAISDLHFWDFTRYKQYIHRVSEKLSKIVSVRTSSNFYQC